MSNQEPNSGTLVLSQLRASLDGSRYTLKAVYAAIGISFGGAAVIFVLVLLLWHRLRELYAARPLLSRRVGYFSDSSTASQGEEKDVPKRKASASSIPGYSSTFASSSSSINDKNQGAQALVGPFVYPESSKVPEKEADSGIQRAIGFRACVKEAWASEEKQILQNSGLDAVIYLRALRMTRNIFALLTLFLFCTAAPINIVYNLRQPYVTNLTHQDALLLLTPSLLSSHQMIPHVVLGWVSNILVLSILWHNYRYVIALRRSVLTSRQYKDSVHNRTVMLTDLPRELRSTGNISLSLASVNPLGQSPEGVFLGHKTGSELEELLSEHTKRVKLYESRCTGKNEVETKSNTLKPEALALAQEIVQLTHTINRLRNTSVGRLNNHAFASYSTVRSAHLTVRSGSRGSSFAVGGRENTRLGGLRMAPPPAQIVWKNLKLSQSERGSKQLVVNALYGTLLVFWIVPSAFIGCFLSNLTRLGNVWPAFGRVMDAHPVLFAILQGFLAPSITTLVFTILPLLFRRLSHLQGKVTRTEREQEVLRKLYAFFFLDNFFVFTIMGVVWDVVAQVLQQTHDAKAAGQTLTFHEVWISLRVAQRIATAIVNISSFWVMYLFRCVLGLLAGIAQPLSLLKKGSAWLTGQSHRQTARGKAESEMPQPFQYAVSFLSLLFNTTIALGFTTIQPLVLPATFIFFLLAVPLKKYEIYHMQVTKYESQGSFYPLVNDIILFAVAFGNLMLLCVVWVQAGWRIAAPAAPLSITVIIFKVVTYFKFDVPFSRICLDDLEDTKEFPNEASSKDSAVSDSTDTVKCYEEPNMTRPLEKPLLTFRDAVLHYANFEPELNPFKDPKYEVYDEDPEEHMYPSGYTPVEPYPAYHHPLSKYISRESDHEPLAPYEPYMPEHDEAGLLSK